MSIKKLGLILNIFWSSQMSSQNFNKYDILLFIIILIRLFLNLYKTFSLKENIFYYGYHIFTEHNKQTFIYIP